MPREITKPREDLRPEKREAEFRLCLAEDQFETYTDCIPRAFISSVSICVSTERVTLSGGIIVGRKV